MQHFHRNALQSAMINYGLLRDVKPSEEEVREYFTNNRHRYRQLGIVNGRQVLAFDPFYRKGIDDDDLATWADLPELLAKSDFVTGTVVNVDGGHVAGHLLN